MNYSYNGAPQVKCHPSDRIYLNGLTFTSCPWYTRDITYIVRVEMLPDGRLQISNPLVVRKPHKWETCFSQFWLLFFIPWDRNSQLSSRFYAAAVVWASCAEGSLLLITLHYSSKDRLSATSPDLLWLPAQSWGVFACRCYCKVTIYTSNMFPEVWLDVLC